jgi:penicillin-binding protein-related factor A (putative recombinase)
MPTSPAPENDKNDQNCTISEVKFQQDYILIRRGLLLLFPLKKRRKSTRLDASRFPSHLKTMAPIRQQPKIKCQYIL